MSTQDPWQILADAYLLTLFAEDAEVPNPCGFDPEQLPQTASELQRTSAADEFFDEQVMRRVIARLYKPTAAQFLQALEDAYRQALDET